MPLPLMVELSWQKLWRTEESGFDGGFQFACLSIIKLTTLL